MAKISNVSKNARSKKDEGDETVEKEDLTESALKGTHKEDFSLEKEQKAKEGECEHKDGECDQSHK